MIALKMIFSRWWIMIRLVKNEYIKIGFYKIIIMFIIFFIIVCLLYKYNSLDVALNKSFNLIPFVGVSSSILFSGIISTEYTNGNLRYYLTKPVKRWKIYFSKIISIFLYMLILVAFLILVNLIFIKKFDTSYMFKFILYSSSLIFIGTHIIFFSTLFKNTALVVGINMFITIFSFIVSQILLGYGFVLIEYTPFPYLELNLFNDKMMFYNINQDLGCNLSLRNGIRIDIIYSILYYILGNKMFNKKDIRI